MSLVRTNPLCMDIVTFSIYPTMYYSRKLEYSVTLGEEMKISQVGWSNSIHQKHGNAIMMALNATPATAPLFSYAPILVMQLDVPVQLQVPWTLNETAGTESIDTGVTALAVTWEQTLDPKLDTSHSPPE